MKNSESLHFFALFLYLLRPAYLLLNLLEALKQEHVELGVDPHPSVWLARPSVLEHEAHPLLLQLEGVDRVPRELDDLILQTSVIFARLEPVNK